MASPETQAARADREASIDESILRCLKAALPYSVPTRLIEQSLSRDNHHIDLPEIGAHLGALRAKGLIREADPSPLPAARRYTITGEGIDALNATAV